MCRLVETFALVLEERPAVPLKESILLDALAFRHFSRHQSSEMPLPLVPFLVHSGGAFVHMQTPFPELGTSPPGLGSQPSALKPCGCDLWKTGWDSLSLVEVGLSLWLMQGVRDDPDTTQTGAYSYDWQLICSLLGSSFESQSLWVM